MIVWRTIRTGYLAFIALMLFFSSAVLAVEQILVLALFPGKAMVEVDGHRRVLEVGHASPEGVLLISADAEEAVLEVNGQRDSYTLGQRITGSFHAPERREVRILRDANGGYTIVGNINGHMVNMLVDTGATTIAISEPEAKRLGIPYRLKGERKMVNTASGTAPGYAVTLDRVQVGPITLRQIPAMVLEGNSPQYVLLGMTFLSHVEIENVSNVMILRAKY